MLTPEILEFHHTNYQSLPIALCEEFETGVKISFFEQSEIKKVVIENYRVDGKLKSAQEYNSCFELVEYRIWNYDESGDHISDKIFFADSWTIHTEKMI